MTVKSCIYEGHIRHRRFIPVQNFFQYRLFMMYLDLAELPTLFKGMWFWAYDRFNLAYFRRKDHHGNPEIPLDRAIRDLVKKQLGTSPGGPIRLLTHLRYFGYCFNPVSFYYCFDRADQAVEAIVVEIHNTPWGEEHCYVLGNASDSNATQQWRRFQMSKAFHISPFMDMDIHYDWQFSDPGKRIHVHMLNLKKNKKLFEARLTLQQRPINGLSLTRVLIVYPFMTSKVITMIYWQALRLWVKGVPFYEHPSERNPDKEKHLS